MQLCCGGTAARSSIRSNRNKAASAAPARLAGQAAQFDIQPVRRRGGMVAHRLTALPNVNVPSPLKPLRPPSSSSVVWRPCISQNSQRAPRGRCGQVRGRALRVQSGKHSHGQNRPAVLGSPLLRNVIFSY